MQTALVIRKHYRPLNEHFTELFAVQAVRDLASSRTAYNKDQLITASYFAARAEVLRDIALFFHNL